MENYCASFIKKKKGHNFDFINDYNRAKSSLKRELNAHLHTLSPYLPADWSGSPLSVSLPTQIVYCEHILRGSSVSNSTISTFKNLHGDLIRIRVLGKQGINELRNSIAHKGIGIASKRDINDYINVDFEIVINQWNTEFSLPTENVFIISNREIEDFLRNQVI
jgi:hypothetical protein